MNIMRTFLKQMFRVYATSSAVRGNDFIPHNIHFQFNRSLPTDEKYIGEALNLYKDYVSTRTLLERVPFIEDVDREMERLEEEADMNLRKDFLNNTVNSEGQPVENVNNEIKELQAKRNAQTGDSSDK